jgi:hypothetical protein
MQRQLLDQGGAQFGIIVDNQDFAGIYHLMRPERLPRDRRRWAK